MATLPLTLADYAAEPKPLVAGVVNISPKESKIMDILPFVGRWLFERKGLPRRKYAFHLLA
jgi:hypothetical protein